MRLSAVRLRQRISMPQRTQQALLPVCLKAHSLPGRSAARAPGQEREETFRSGIQDICYHSSFADPAVPAYFIFVHPSPFIPPLSFVSSLSTFHF